MHKWMTAATFAGMFALMAGGCAHVILDPETPGEAGAPAASEAAPTPQARADSGGQPSEAAREVREVRAVPVPLKGRVTGGMDATEEPPPAESAEGLPSGCDLGTAPASPPRAIAVISTKPGSSAVQPTGRYSIYGLESLFIGALVENLCGPQHARFELYAPDGSLYREISFPFVAAGDGDRAIRSGEGYLTGVNLPIAGTDIAERLLLGVWSVNFAIGSGDALTGVGLFELTR